MWHDLAGTGHQGHLASKPVSMRLGFDGLAALVRPLFAVEPHGGHVFLFRSKSGNYLKALHWDGSGLCLLPGTRTGRD
jgi:transposase